MKDRKLKILAFFDYFFPGQKSGGPARSSLGFYEHVGQDMDLSVITRDRDVGDFHSYKNVKLNMSNEISLGFVYYVTGIIQLIKLLKRIDLSSFDYYYFNSFFSFQYTILPLMLIRLRFIPRKNTVLSPRGELADSALSLKRKRKLAYLQFYNLFYRKLIMKYHATSKKEKKDIHSRISGDKSIHELPNLRPDSDLNKQSYCRSIKKEGQLKIIYLSRISPVKNIEFMIDVLNASDGNIILDIYGFITDKVYWNQVKMKLTGLRKNLEINYRGEVGQNDVYETISQYDLYFLPSKGENFSQGILDSLIASRPILTSDQTYWNSLNNENAGWNFPLADKHGFVECINALIGMSQKDFEVYCKNAFRLARKYFDKIRFIKDKYLEMFSI